MAWLMQNGVYLVLLLVGVILLYRAYGWEGLPSAFLTIFGIGFIIFVHELGHFLVAKWCDVHVLTFSIGFGPVIPGCSFKRGETLYKISLLPLGGYVNMVGEGTDADEDESYPRSFKNKTVGQRMAIISAGVIMNILFGILAFILVFLTKGVLRTAPVMGGVDSGSPAWVGGVRDGWVLKSIDGKPIKVWDDMRSIVALSMSGDPGSFEFVDPHKPDEVIHRTMHPRKVDLHPVIGVRSPIRLEMGYSPTIRLSPVPPTPPASKVQPHDVIVECTDPEKSQPGTPNYDPQKTTPL